VNARIVPRDCSWSREDSTRDGRVADGRDRDSVRGELSENIADDAERNEFDDVGPEFCQGNATGAFRIQF
jgi:hypothetical protein